MLTCLVLSSLLGAAPAAEAAPAKVKIAAFDLAGGALSKELSAALSAVIPETLDRLGVFDAISSQEIAKILSFEAQKQQFGCDDVSCLADIGGALGAAYLVTGSLTRVAGQVVLQMQLLRSAGAQVVERLSREHQGDDKGLFELVRSATQALVRKLLDARSGTLMLAVSEEGATVRIDERIIGVTPLPPTQAPGGMHLLTIEKEGFVAFRQDVDVRSEAETALTVNLRPSAEWLNAYRESASLVRTLAWVGVAVGAVGVVGGGVLFGVAGGQATRLDKDVRAYNDDPARTTGAYDNLMARQRSVARLDVTALVGFAVGVAALATGVGLFVFGDDPERYDVVTTAGPAAGLALSLDAGPAGWGLSGRF